MVVKRAAGRPKRRLVRVRPDGSKARRTSKAAPGSAREQLLDSAEELFAENGYNGVSTRDIAAAAKVNLGSIPYYFGSKENLFKEVIRRRAVPELQDRAAGVRRLMTAARGRSLSVVEILRADLEPVFLRRRENATYRRLAGRVATDPSDVVRRVVNEIYSREATVFDVALRRACPHLTHVEFYWRFSCLFGAVQYVLADVGKIQALAGRRFRTADPKTALRYVIPFLAAGLMAPPST